MYLPTYNQPNLNPKIIVKIENMIDILSKNVSPYNLEKLFPSLHWCLTWVRGLSKPVLGTRVDLRQTF